MGEMTFPDRTEVPPMPGDPVNVVLRAPVSRRAWAELLYMLASIPLAVLGSAFAVVTLALSAGLAVTAAGFPLLAAGLGGAQRITATDLLAASPAGVGYLLKERVGDIDDFVDALHRVASGGTALDPEMVGHLLNAGRRGVGALTPREREVLGLMAEGRTNAAITKVLFVSDRAVEKHIANIFLKLGLSPSGDDHRRVLAVLHYLGA
jgi:DNA-binding CsgD family transcriptional regulator